MRGNELRRGTVAASRWEGCRRSAPTSRVVSLIHLPEKVPLALGEGCQPAALQNGEAFKLSLRSKRVPPGASGSHDPNRKDVHSFSVNGRLFPHLLIGGEFIASCLKRFECDRTGPVLQRRAQCCFNGFALASDHFAVQSTLNFVNRQLNFDRHAHTNQRLHAGFPRDDARRQFEHRQTEAHALFSGLRLKTFGSH